MAISLHTNQPQNVHLFGELFHPVSALRYQPLIAEAPRTLRCAAAVCTSYSRGFSTTQIESEITENQIYSK